MAHDLGLVVRFEFRRTVRKKAFWLSALAAPVFIALVLTIAIIGNKTAIDRSSSQTTASFSTVYLDDSGAVNPALLTAFGAKPVATATDGIAQVRTGKIDAFFHYPKNLAAEGIAVYGKDTGLFDNNKYSAVADTLLQQSVGLHIADKSLLTLVQGKYAPSKTVTYDHGTVAEGWNAVYLPLGFLIIFMLSVMLIGGVLVNSTTEEKENRVTEMIRVSLRSKTLVVGKIIAILAAGLLQIAALVLPVVIALVWFAPALGIPLELGALSITVPAAVFGVVVLIGGVMLITGVLVGIGAVLPTAREATQWLGVVIIVVMIPLYTFSMILSDPTAPLVQVFLYFPLTAPTTALMMNGLGYLSVTQGIVVSTELLVAGVVAIGVAIRLFERGSVEYSRALTLKDLVRNRRMVRAGR
ncbi:MAG: ABC transporter permease [Microbacteriaceae bacterium]|nr:ABC transporter permease [Microbacteriaceae bacterium]